MASATDEAKFSRYRVRDDRHDKGTNGRVVRRGSIRTLVSDVESDAQHRNAAKFRLLAAL